MAERGDVFELKRSLGFARTTRPERVLVAQSDDLDGLLETVLVVPLDDALELYDRDPLALRVPALEAGVQHDLVAIPTLLRPMRVDHLAPARAARLDATTLERLDALLLVVLGLV